MVCAISGTSSSVVTKGGPDLQRVVVDGARLPDGIAGIDHDESAARLG